jgi:phytoene synthase
MICRNEPIDDMDGALAMYIERNNGDLELSPFIDMISGMQADSVQNRTISNMAELDEYAYQVAGTVGLMLLPLLNANVEQSRAAAISLGKAIQLINILRDASPDVALGRVYLPQDMLRAEGVTTEDVLQLKSSPGYRKVVATVADRAKAYLLEAEIGKSTLPGMGPLFVQIIVELYREYLVKLEQIGYDNLNLSGEHVKISTMQKLMASFKAAIIVLTKR